MIPHRLHVTSTGVPARSDNLAGMLVAAAVCPHPPALLPALAAGAASELDEVRAACDYALDAVRVAAPELLVVVGAGATARSFPPGSRGSFAPYGVDVEVRLPGRGEATAPGPLPLPLAVGAWLLERAGWTGDVAGEEIDRRSGGDQCAATGAALARRADRMALLVMADGSACRSVSAPRPFDPRGESFDGEVAAALAAADPTRLLALDTTLATALAATGVPAWQVLAGAAGESTLDTEMLYDGAPYGVGYLVAVWEQHG